MSGPKSYELQASRREQERQRNASRCAACLSAYARLANEPNPAAAVERLFKAAMAAGGKDNITIILADVSTEQDEGDDEAPAPSSQ